MSSIPAAVMKAIESGDKISPRHVFNEAELAFIARNRLVSPMIDPGSCSCEALGLLEIQKRNHTAILKALRELHRHTRHAPHYMILKGLSFEYSIYGKGVHRDTSDIDVLLRPSDVLSMHKVLLSMGYHQQTGPSSMGAANVPSRALTTIRASQNLKDLRSNKPVRRHPFKGELSPYVKNNSPTIEVHDSFRSLPRRYTEHLIKNAATSESCLLTGPLDTLVLLICTAYDNSESIFSTCFDQKTCLRDYCDLIAFFRKYSRQLSQEAIWDTFAQLGIQKKANKVAENLGCLYEGKETALLCDFHNRSSRTHNAISFTNRISNTELARQYGLGLLHKELLEISRQNPLGLASPKAVVPPPSEAAVVFKSDGINIIADIYLPSTAPRKDELFQLAIYPLGDDLDYIAFKIDISWSENGYRAFGRKSKRLLSGAALQKDTGTEYPIATSLNSDGVFLHAVLPISVKSPFCAEFNRFKHNHGNVFWLSQEPRWMIDGDLAIGDLQLIETRNQSIDIEMTNCICRITSNDHNCLESIAMLFPYALQGSLRSKNNKSLYTYNLVKTKDGYSLTNGGRLLIEKSSKKVVSAILLDEIANMIVEEAHDRIFAAHAATVLIEDNCILLMGKSGSGKSSLAQALANLTVVLGDECSLINTETGTAQCENFPINLKRQNYDVLKNMQTCKLLEVANHEHGSSFYSPIEHISAKPALIKAIVMPTYSPKSPRSLLHKMPYAQCSKDILASLIGKQTPSNIFASFSSMLATQNVELYALEFSDAETGALALIEQFSEKTEVENACSTKPTRLNDQR